MNLSSPIGKIFWTAKYTQVFLEKWNEIFRIFQQSEISRRFKYVCWDMDSRKVRTLLYCMERLSDGRRIRKWRMGSWPICVVEIKFLLNVPGNGLEPS